jgi:hypothetical protein
MAHTPLTNQFSLSILCEGMKDPEAEVARILRAAAGRIERREVTAESVTDSKGRTVGGYSFVLAFRPFVNPVPIPPASTE